MEESDEGAAASASATEAALGFSPDHLVNEFLNVIDDVSDDAFEYCLQEGAPKALGATRAAEKAEELERGINSIHDLVNNVLDRRMTSWEDYCLQHCFTVPEGFVVNEDNISRANVSSKNGTPDSDLDTELDSLRRKLESAYKESDSLQREMSSLERQTTYKRKFDSAIAEIQKLLQDKSVQKNFEEFAKAIPKLQEKLIGMRKISAEAGRLGDQQIWNIDGLRNSKRQALGNGFTANVEDVQEVVKLLRKQ